MRDFFSFKWKERYGQLHKGELTVSRRETNTKQWIITKNKKAVLDFILFIITLKTKVKFSFASSPDAMRA